MKKTKKFMTMLVAVLMVGGTVLSFSATTKKKSTTKKSTAKKSTTKLKNARLVNHFKCGNETVEVVYGDDVAELKSKAGTYLLKLVPSADGALYSNSRGISIHTKANEALYTVNGKDTECKIVSEKNKTSKSSVQEYKFKGTVKVEQISSDTVKVTDFSGKTYTLKEAVSGSGAFYQNSDGVSLHLKANDGILTINGVDYSISK